MNKLVSALLLGLLFTACQDTPKNAADNTAAPLATPAPPVPASAEDMQQAAANLTTGIKMLEDLRKQADGLPAKIKKEKSAEIEGIYASIEGMINKQTGMLNEIKATLGLTPEQMVHDSEAGSLDAAHVKDYNESAARYAKEAQVMQEAVTKMSAPAAKN